MAKEPVRTLWMLPVRRLAAGSWIAALALIRLPGAISGFRPKPPLPASVCLVLAGRHRPGSAEPVPGRKTAREPGLADHLSWLARPLPKAWPRERAQRPGGPNWFESAGSVLLGWATPSSASPARRQ